MEKNFKEIEFHKGATSSSLQSKEPTISFKAQCCIYKVPDYIQRGKEECYRPLTTSIGPVFYKDPRLEAMQEFKRIYMNSFISKHPARNHESYTNFVGRNENEIRKCYQHEIYLQSHEFIEMIVLDATFIVSLFLAKSKSTSHDPPSFNSELPKVRKRLHLPSQCLTRDLFVEENQLPFFILEGIYNIAFKNVNPCRSFAEVALEFINNNVATKILRWEAIKSIICNGDENFTDIQHLVDLHRMFYCLLFYGQEVQNMANDNRFHKFHSANQLSDAGVKFEPIESDDPLPITFNEGVLKIPKLYLVDKTESILRNLLFFEQCHCVPHKYFTDYMVFLDTLVDTVDDVQVLQKKEILVNCLGSDEDATDLFNNLTKNAFYNFSDYLFSSVSKDLKEYASRRRNRWKAILRRRYFNHPWAIISVVYAIILLVLTILQTITGFLQIDS